MNTFKHTPIKTKNSKLLVNKVITKKVQNRDIQYIQPYKEQKIK